MVTAAPGPVSGVGRSDEVLTARQRRAVVAVLTAPTLGEAAAAVQVSARTLRRWRSREVFARAVRQAAREMDREAVDALRAATVDAVATLRRALDEDAPAVRVRAAVAIVGAAERARDDDLDARLSALEQRVQEAQAWPA